MATVKLTLSADEKVVRKARELARRNKTSISAMFSGMVLALSKREGTKSEAEIGPLTRKALGLVKLPAGKSDREIVEEALAEKHGFKG
jgi:hypothetical protein